MKHRRGCQSCRSRHRKCVFPKDGRVCYGCLETGSECLPPPKFIFTFAPQSIQIPPSMGEATNGARVEAHVRSVSDPIHRTSALQRSDESELSQPMLSEREGQLFMIYVKQLAPMMDSCDEARHFTLTVPRLALRDPMLLNSILAMASRYDALRNNVAPDVEAIKYNHKCIEWLIASFSKPPSTYGSELLSAVVMTRSYEECDFEADLSHHHLSGTRNLLSYDTVAEIASKGGLAEAACWVHLRQAIYAYLVRRRPVDRHIDAFKNLGAFTRTDDAAYANRMVYHFARILRLFFQSSHPKGAETKDTWISLQVDTTEWFKNKPLSFSPIFAAVDDKKQFPTLLMLSSAPVMGLQYYYAANIMLQLKECNGSSSPGGNPVTLPKEPQRLTCHYMCTLMGLALSNDHVLDSFLLPMHMLSICGHCINDGLKQKKTLQFLKKANELIQWTTDPLVDSLSKQWAEANGLGKEYT